MEVETVLEEEKRESNKRMIETILIKYLTEQNIESIGDNVYAEVPAKDIPDNYLVISKLGSSEQDGIYHASVSIDSISNKSLLKAMTINEAVREVMETFAETEAVHSCKFNSDFNNTNTATKEYRYEAVFDFYM